MNSVVGAGDSKMRKREILLKSVYQVYFRTSSMVVTPV